ncbi:collagen alpha-5(VI) chain-like isoform X1 [Tachysurus ichikawai]
MNSAAENFNRNSSLVSDHQEKSKVYPNKLVLQILEQKNMNSNNNNNKYQGTQTGLQDHLGKRRARQSDSSTDTNEEDQDAGTEIAVVLDGSGSIEPEDFERAKNFIHTLMKNVWRTCFNCKFAVVQFGRDIRTELSLKENNDHLSALDKVKNIKQITYITKTASALYHVLTDVFVPESGSKENAKKTIILLSDGQMLGDARNLTEVLNMPQMEGVVRYAIGVGPEVLNNSQAIKEMTEISGNEDRFFGLCNYVALETLLSSLEKSIIRIEDAGIEIAFVLDGSSSIDPEDFESVKDFISNMMKNVWTICFSCKFAVVQFGRDIRTELSLKENNDHLSALDKVKNIKQITALTRTASALYHVLTDVFVPESGSKENAKKMIILLSDGQMSGDTRNLTEVLNMPQMEGVVRYAIGLGSEVLNKAQALREMIEIAGSEEKFFKVSSYSALKDILSSLQRTLLRTAESCSSDKESIEEIQGKAVETSEKDEGDVRANEEESEEIQEDITDYIPFCCSIGPCQAVAGFPKNPQGWSFQSQWYAGNKWLEYSLEKDAMYCFSCRLFLTEDKFKARTAWRTSGVVNWRKAVEKIHEHSTTEAHMISMVRWANYRKGPLVEAFKAQAAECGLQNKKERQKNREILFRLIDITVYLARQGLAFRGHDESSTSSNRGNFLELVHLLAEYDSVLRMHLEHIQITQFQKKKAQVTLLSNRTQNDLIRSLGTQVATPVFQETAVASAALQHKDVDLAVSYTLVEGVLKRLQELRTESEFKVVFEKAKERAEAAGIEFPDKIPGLCTPLETSVKGGKAGQVVTLND